MDFTLGADNADYVRYKSDFSAFRKQYNCCPFKYVTSLRDFIDEMQSLLYQYFVPVGLSR